MTEHVIKLLLTDQQDISAHKPVAERWLSTLKQSPSGEQVGGHGVPEPALAEQSVPANDFAKELAEYARKHYCLLLESSAQPGEGSAAGGSSDSWVCVPANVMPEQLPGLASSLILVPHDAERPQCSNEPEEGAEIYFKPASWEAFDTSRKEGMFAGYVSETLLDTVSDVLKNCEPAQPESCPGVLMGCRT